MPTRSKIEFFLKQIFETRSQNGGVDGSIGKLCRILSWLIFTKNGKYFFFLETEKAFSFPGETICKENLLRLRPCDQPLKSSKFRKVVPCFVVEISVRTFCYNAFSFEKIKEFILRIISWAHIRKWKTKTSLDDSSIFFERTKKK